MKDVNGRDQEGLTTYANPVARHGDFADPFILRYDGCYYLYCTNPDARCWRSNDLMNWEPCGSTIPPEEFPGLVPFAPEVWIQGGKFWMYTSPSGLGHYVLCAESPRGPFHRVTDNVGHAIDGTVLLDDDGRSYFYWAGDEGIWGCEMPSPTEFGEPVLTGVTMNGWTEGPLVTHDSHGYTMTLTGNHYLSRGYRVDAAVSDHPLSGWQTAPTSPIVIGADGPLTGLGHSSSVRGPDLVSTWIAYHDIKPDRSRDLNLDRQIWNGRSPQILGGPSSSAIAPSGPDEVWTTGVSPVLGSVFTAELNVTVLDPRAETGLRVTGLTDTSGSIDDLQVRIIPDRGIVVADRRGSATGEGPAKAEAPLPPGFSRDSLHCWLVISDGETIDVQLDGRHQFRVCGSASGDTRIEVLDADRMRVGHCSATRMTPADAQMAVSAPVPGRFPAILTEDSRGRSRPTGDGLLTEVGLHTGDQLTYGIHVQQAGPVTVHLSGHFSRGDVVTVACGRSVATTGVVPEPTTLISVPAELTDTDEHMRISCEQGAPVLAMVIVSERVKTLAMSIPPGLTGNGVSDTGKCLVDSGPWEDVTVEAALSVHPTKTGGHGDLLLRASQLADGGEGDDPVLGRDFLLGYSVQVRRNRLVVARHDYDEKVLAEAPLPSPRSPGPGGCPQADERSEGVSVVARMRGGRIAVEIDGATILDVEDERPHVCGGVGIRWVDADLHVSDFRVCGGRSEDGCCSRNARSTLS